MGLAHPALGVRGGAATSTEGCRICLPLGPGKVTTALARAGHARGPPTSLHLVAGADDDSASVGGAPADAAGAEPPTKKDKQGKKKKKQKAGKLEPGMAEAQAWGSACLRVLSAAEGQQQALLAAGAPRYLLPLVEQGVAAARCNARQVRMCGVVWCAGTAGAVLPASGSLVPA